MTIEGADRAAVLLNGKTPDFFVGHGDEFDHEWWWKQELVVPPGTYQVTILGGDQDLWSGPVDVAANQRVVVKVPKGVRKLSLGREARNSAPFRASKWAMPAQPLPSQSPRQTCRQLRRN
jgi:hypothetical protein